VPPGVDPKGKLKSNYFFLTGFLVAFFFAIVAFSFGLDFGAAAFTAGFFFTGIRDSPLRSLLLDERKTELPFCSSSERHYRNLLCNNQAICDFFINKF
jgi:hypothetical protein